MSFTVKRVPSAAELEQLFHIRYRAFVEEMHYYPPNPSGQIVDEYDHGGGVHHIIGTHDDHVIAGVRLVEFDASGGTPVDEFFDFSAHLPAGPCKLAVGSMLCIVAERRGMCRLLVKLMAAFHQAAIDSGVTHIICAAAPLTEPVLARYGYPALAPLFFH